MDMYKLSSIIIWIDWIELSSFLVCGFLLNDKFQSQEMEWNIELFFYFFEQND